MGERTADPAYMVGPYFEYQQRYAETMRESDKALLALMADALRTVQQHGGRLLDIGCSSGNLLRHLRNVAPGIEYWGGDIQPEVIARCNASPELAGIRFDVMSVMELPPEPKFDIVVASAVLFRFPDAEFEAACAQIAGALAPSGVFFSWDFYHEFEQDLAIIERSTWHPKGLTLHFRSMDNARAILRRSGLVAERFIPFDIPIDLAVRDEPGGLHTYTQRTEDGRRLQFRGALYQPWSHLVARKA